MRVKQIIAWGLILAMCIDQIPITAFALEENDTISILDCEEMCDKKDILLDLDEDLLEESDQEPLIIDGISDENGEDDTIVQTIENVDSEIVELVSWNWDLETENIVWDEEKKNLDNGNSMG